MKFKLILTGCRVRTLAEALQRYLEHERLESADHRAATER